VPLTATAPALLYVGCIMTRALAELDWQDASEYAPAVLTCDRDVPLTFSISECDRAGVPDVCGREAHEWARARVSCRRVGSLAALFAVKFLARD
jgi:AGZA family xanthine/uracil permease-like MFS transporter